MSNMNIQCFYRNQRAFYQGVDINKMMHKVKTEDGAMHYPEHLGNIDFRDHSTEQELFKEPQKNREHERV